MDYDIDMEDAAGQVAPAQAEATVELTLDDGLPPTDDILGTSTLDGPEAGEIDEVGEAATLVPTKVHLRGLDALTPDDIKAYLAEHVSTAADVDAARRPYDRIEWIDDTSANLVFPTAERAAAALVALSLTELAEDQVAQLPVGVNMPAKTYTAKAADVSAGLLVRMAVAADKKQAGAAQRSRFYLLHPEYDPEERRRRNGHDRGDRRRGDRRRDRSDRYDDRDDRERDIRNNSFDVNLYDDDAPSRASRGPDRGRDRSRDRSRDQSRDRGRGRGRDGRRRRRSYSPRSRSRSPDVRHRNRDKELFADGTAVDRARGKELFPPKELFEDSQRSYRDRDDDDYDGRVADERAEEAARVAARHRDKARAERDRLAAVRDARGGRGGRAGRDGRNGSRAHMDLFDDSNVTRIAYDDDEPAAPASSTYNIRGLARSDEKGSGRSDQPGLAIKGRANARELFPNASDGTKTSTVGQGADLASRISRPRKRAQDLFH